MENAAQSQTWGCKTYCYQLLDHSKGLWISLLYCIVITPPRNFLHLNRSRDNPTQSTSTQIVLSRLASAHLRMAKCRCTMDRSTLAELQCLMKLLRPLAASDFIALCTSLAPLMQECYMCDAAGVAHFCARSSLSLEILAQSVLSPEVIIIAERLPWLSVESMLK